MAWGRALLDAVKQGDLPIVAKNGSPEAMDRERQNPHYMTQVTRDAQAMGRREGPHASVSPGVSGSFEFNRYR